METVRIPLPTILEPRDGTNHKDGLLTNCYTEENPEGWMIVKRPGLAFASSFPGVGQGAVYFGGKGVFVVGDTLYVVNLQTLHATLKAGGR